MTEQKSLAADAMNTLLASGKGSLLACNIYVSAGRIKHSKILTSLIHKCQDECRSLTSTDHKKGVVGLVHAYADEAYDRSSFHLAGTADLVAEVASNLAVTALTNLKNFEVDTINSEDNDKKTTHPFVGFVDHVSVMPLLIPHMPDSHAGFKDSNMVFKLNEKEMQVQREEASNVSKAIGSSMADLGCVVYSYGSACKENTPLAIVRREKTRFFRSGGLDKDSPPVESSGTSSGSPYGIACVGSPDNFTENFNIRLIAGSEQETKLAAISLARRIRERDGGIVGVEALSLPYYGGTFEVACNLLQPREGSRDSIRKEIESWLYSYNKVIKAHHDHALKSPIVSIDDAYGVGTTQLQCLEVLQKYFQIEPSNSFGALYSHDKKILEQFDEYFSDKV